MTTTLSLSEALTRIRTRLEDPGLSVAEADLLRTEIQRIRAMVSIRGWTPYPWQTPPGAIPTHGSWTMLGGRGTGKTEGAARYLNDHMSGPPCDVRIKGGHRAAIIAPTLGDAAESCVTGPSGLQTINPSLDFKGGVGGQHVIWANGSKARIFGAYTKQDVDRLRAGGNRCIVWMEEAAAMRYLDSAMTHTALGLRIGFNAHYVISTTPTPRKEIKSLVRDPKTRLTRGRTRDAIHLDPAVRAALEAKYEGTRMGRQELDAEILDDVEGALWSNDLIDRNRRPAAPPCDYIVVAVDPPGSTSPGAECGIVVIGRVGREAWVLQDLSGTMTPDEWGRAVVAAYKRWQANVVVVETNYGGDMAVHTIRTVKGAGTVPIVRVTARRGKRLRAEPVVALYEQNRIHHVGVLPALETQMTGWVPDDPVAESPDRIDALVHGVTHVLVDSGEPGLHTPSSSRRISEPVRRPGG